MLSCEGGKGRQGRGFGGLVWLGKWGARICKGFFRCCSCVGRLIRCVFIDDVMTESAQL